MVIFFWGIIARHVSFLPPTQYDYWGESRVRWSIFDEKNWKYAIDQRARKKKKLAQANEDEKVFIPSFSFLFFFSICRVVILIGIYSSLILADGRTLFVLLIGTLLGSNILLKDG